MDYVQDVVTIGIVLELRKSTQSILPVLKFMRAGIAVHVKLHDFI